MTTPQIQDIPDHFSKDGLKSFLFQSAYATGVPVEYTGEVQVELKDSLGVTAWLFSTELDGDYKLVLLPDGFIQFPRIIQWDIKSTKYEYTLKEIEPDGFVRTDYIGIWNVGKASSGAGETIRGTVLYPEKGEKGDTPTLTFNLTDGMILTLTTE